MGNAEGAAKARVQFKLSPQERGAMGGPKTPEGKAIVSMNALKTGEYAEVFQLNFSCTGCHFQDFCHEYEQGVDHKQCPFFSGGMSQAVELYKDPRARARVQAATLEMAMKRALVMGGKEAIFWAGLLNKALDTLIRSEVGEKAPGQDGEKLAMEATRISILYERLQKGEDPLAIAAELRAAKAKARIFDG